jgi:hypothetical protein
LDNSVSGLGLLAEDLVLVAGEPVDFVAEFNADRRNIDHFWITIRAGRFGRLRISINTMSRKHALAGFDPRMRVGVLSSTWKELPPEGVFPVSGLDYAQLEQAQPVEYEALERHALENLLIEKSRRALFVEGWGALYLRDQIGIHQVHSRRASSSVPTDHIGRDGALRFYFAEDRSAEMLLFKYAGQP